MTRNVVQMHEEIKKKQDFVNNPRFGSRAYDDAINEAVEQMVNDRYDNFKRRKSYSVESVQRVKDELYTIILDAVTLSKVGDVAAFPVDYKHTLLMTADVNSVTQVVVPVPFDELRHRMDNTFTAPDAENPIFTQASNGFTLYHGSNTLGDVKLTYMKHPATVSRGLPDELLTSADALTGAASYIAVEDDTVQNSVTYYTGEVFTAVGTVLTSGSVVLRSDTTDCDLPGTAHKEVIDLAAAIMEGWVDEFQSKQSLEFDATKS